MGLIHDPEAEKRSVMYKQKSLCNGQKTGRSCIHYWMHIEKVESVNADNLRLGEIFRGCTFAPSIVHEMSENQLATRCTMYVPRRLPLYKRPLAVLGLVADPGKFDADVEEYNPLTPEQINALRSGGDERALPPVVGAPSGDAQINSLKKEVGLDAAMAALGDDDDGIFNKGEEV